MTFSQIWDTGFKSIMIFIGTVFVWLCFFEKAFADRGFSVLLMNTIGIVLAGAFFIVTRRRCIRERDAANAEIAALIKEVE